MVHYYVQVKEVFGWCANLLFTIHHRKTTPGRVRLIATQALASLVFFLVQAVELEQVDDQVDDKCCGYQGDQRAHESSPREVGAAPSNLNMRAGSLEALLRPHDELHHWANETLN